MLKAILKNCFHKRLRFSSDLPLLLHWMSRRVALLGWPAWCKFAAPTQVSATATCTRISLDDFCSRQKLEGTEKTKVTWWFQLKPAQAKMKSMISGFHELRLQHSRELECDKIPTTTDVFVDSHPLAQDGCRSELGQAATPLPRTEELELLATQVHILEYMQ